MARSYTRNPASSQLFFTPRTTLVYLIFKIIFIFIFWIFIFLDFHFDFDFDVSVCGLCLCLPRSVSVVFRFIWRFPWDFNPRRQPQLPAPPRPVVPVVGEGACTCAL